MTTHLTPPTHDDDIAGELWYDLPALAGGLVVDATGPGPVTYRTGALPPRTLTREELTRTRAVLKAVLATPQDTMRAAARAAEADWHTRTHPDDILDTPTR